MLNHDGRSLVCSCAITLVGASGCNVGAQMVLKSPIEDRCVSAGLNRCDAIAHGATLYADGDAREGEKQLQVGLSANADKVAELKKFADALALIGKVPGAGQYVAPLQPAIRLVQRVAADPANRTPPVIAPSAPPVAPVVSVVAKELPAPIVVTPVASPQPTIHELEDAPAVSRFWLVAGNDLATACKFAGTPRMLCLREMNGGKKIITDISVSAACSLDIMIASKAGLVFDWLMYVPAGRGLEVHQTALPLDAKRAFYVGLASKGDDVAPDVRCGVTTVSRDVSKAKDLTARADGGSTMPVATN